MPQERGGREEAVGVVTCTHNRKLQKGKSEIQAQAGPLVTLAGAKDAAGRSIEVDP